MKERITITLNSKALQSADSLVGKNNIQNRSQSIESIINTHFSSDNQLKAILLAGTNSNQDSIIQTLSKLKELKIKEILVAGAKNNEKIFSTINSDGYFSKRSIFLKEDKQLGTAGVIKSAEQSLSGQFITVFADITYNINLKEMINFHKKSNKLITMAITMPENKKELIDNLRITGNNITSFEYDSKTPTKLQNAGIFIFEKKALDSFPTNGSLEKDVLPKFAKNNNLGAFLFDTKWNHKG